MNCFHAAVGHLRYLAGVGLKRRDDLGVLGGLDHLDTIVGQLDLCGDPVPTLE